MKYWLGIDLGSTTTKAVVMDRSRNVLGRGITNSRSDYDVACQVSLGEALTSTRLALVDSELAAAGLSDEARLDKLEQLTLRFRELQYTSQIEAMRGMSRRYVDIMRLPEPAAACIQDILSAMQAEAPGLYTKGASRKSDFFRDLACSRYMSIAEEFSSQRSLRYDQLAAVFDKAILDVENDPRAAGDLTTHTEELLKRIPEKSSVLLEAVNKAMAIELEQVGSVGTGYGRARLPFAEAKIRSEILCHGLGAHAMFPNTRTVLDIGGQDTKAIQVDGKGIVTSFQMNDRCAAGCGRYLGYIADEMNIGVHELGPIASKSKRAVRINSTCTVFAGAELRERLSLGEKREDILAGLHRAIVLRAMSLLARSGGIEDEFTFTGGVANNVEAVSALRRLIVENYGERKLNISPDSIYTGALGAALFALRDTDNQETERQSA